MLGDIDKTLQPQKSRLFLCKPDRTTIAELSEAYDKQLVSNYGGIDELSFRLPFKVEKNKRFIRNDHVDLLRGHFLIRYEKGNITEYFIISQPKNSLQDGIENKSVQCYLLPYELRNKFVRNYSGVKKLYDELGVDGVLNDTLFRKTDWSIGYIDVDIANKYRELDISQSDLLSLMNTLAETYDAIIIWDTKNKTVNFYKDENLGQDKGLSIEYGKYLKAIDEEPDFDNVVTQLYIYGQNGLTINRVNPSGTDFITDFSYYMFPFERDINGNVIRHSNYMTDGLCNAILDYNALLETKTGEFDSLLSQKTTLQETLTTKQNELKVLQDDLAVIEDNLAIANANGDDTTLIVQNKTAKEQEITSKQSEINQVNVDITNVDNQIAILQSEIAIENNFTSEQIVERNSYVKEQIWMDNNYFDDNELYTEGKKQLQKMSQPLIKYSIDIVDFLKNVRSQRDWNKLVKGDIITVRYPNFDIDIKAKIININHNEDNNSINITIANDKDIKNGFLSIKDLLQKGVSASTTVDMSKFKWNQSETNSNQISDIINNTWDATKRTIQAGVNESVDISRKGIIIKDPNDPLKYVIMQHGVIALTLDGGNTWKTAIKPDGIVAERIIGKLIMGNDLIIGDDNGTFLIEGNLLTVKDTNDVIKILLGEYESGKYGIKVMSGAIEIVGGLHDDNISSSATWNNKTTKIDANGIYTGTINVGQLNAGAINTDQISLKSADGKLQIITNAITLTHTDGSKSTLSPAGLKVEHTPTDYSLFNASGFTRYANGRTLPYVSIVDNYNIANTDSRFYQSNNKYYCKIELRGVEYEGRNAKITVQLAEVVKSYTSSGGMVGDAREFLVKVSSVTNVTGGIDIVVEAWKYAIDRIEGSTLYMAYKPLSFNYLLVIQ